MKSSRPGAYRQSSYLTGVPYLLDPLLCEGGGGLRAIRLVSCPNR